MVGNGRLQLHTHFFWTSPLPLWEMPPTCKAGSPNPPSSSARETPTTAACWATGIGRSPPLRRHHGLSAGAAAGPAYPQI
ncbi:MAG: hypothetical protein M5U34_19785 [Chloroflexi bacterium]|nr:hypothetical protein [Chloroflexota bacterium]